MLAVCIYEVLFHPIADGYPDSIQSHTLHLIEVVFSDPSSPMVPKRLVCSILAQEADAVEFGTTVSSSHVLPFLLGHPFLDYEEGA